MAQTDGSLATFTIDRKDKEGLHRFVSAEESNQGPHCSGPDHGGKISARMHNIGTSNNKR